MAWISQRVALALCLLLLVAGFAEAATPRAAPADALADDIDSLTIFAPFSFSNPVNRYRSASGQPGPDYWQNRADYRLHARLDADRHRLTVDETIIYVNHSPDRLHELWLHLPQNRYRAGARADFAGRDDHSPPADEHTAGMTIESARLAYGHAEGTVALHVVGTRARIDLDRPLAAHGGRVRLHIRYHYTVPNARFGGRTSWSTTPHGPIFEIAQWYPRMAVYDDIRGWNTAPFLNQEFYSEYGRFDYDVTVPADMIVVGSGTLDNPQAVLTEDQRARLAQADTSDATVMIRTPAEVIASRPADAGNTLTWRFHIDRARDVAFAASRAFVWDAARIDQKDSPDALAMSVYPPEAGGPDGWGRATQYTRHAIESFARRWQAYPYRRAIAVAGAVGGMEYPGMVFDSKDSRGKALYAITAHEFGHTWFPMVVGSDERRHAWMDEGMNTFIDVLAQAEFNHGEYAPKRDAEFAPDDSPDAGTPADQIVALLQDPEAPPILTRADLIPERYRHPVTYFKAALGLVLLRDDILGPERFDRAFREYIRAWSWRHPQPGDFFRFMDSAAGEDLSWFWRGWYAHNWPLDLAIESIDRAVRKADRNDEPTGTDIVLANHARLVLPATLRLIFADGGHRDLRIPVNAWMQHRRYTVHVGQRPAVVAATLDPIIGCPMSNEPTIIVA